MARSDNSEASTKRFQVERRRVTEVALRTAGLRLFDERGFRHTTADDIAREAGVSPRTFFNYFGSKDAVVDIPRSLFDDVFRQALQARPPGEDPATSVAAAALQLHASLDDPAVRQRARLLKTGIRMTLRFPQMQRRVRERRADLEDVAWSVLLERGTSADDYAARAAVSIVMGLGWHALLEWGTSDADEHLTAVMARWLLATPHPSRFAAALVVPNTPAPPPDSN